MTEEPELKPCPFCPDGQGRLGYVSFDCAPDMYRVDCCSCGGCVELYDTRGDAIAAWNQRAEPEELPEWFRKKIGAAIDYYDHPEMFSKSKADMLRWVLSLKKEADK